MGRKKTETVKRRSSLTDATQIDLSSSYTLDALSRLTTADHPGVANDELFSYDAVGNRLSYTKGSLSPNASTRHYTYTAGTNRLADIRVGGLSGSVESSFTYDHEGRLTNQAGVGAKSLTWDAKGRVRTVGAESYSYDPTDHRIGRSGGTLGNRSYYLEGEHLESEYSGNTLLAKYFRGSSTDELVAAWLLDTDGKTQPFLFHHDQLSSVSAVTGHNGGTTQSIRYDAFGATRSSTGSSPNRLRYTGRESDGTGYLSTPNLALNRTASSSSIWVDACAAAWANDGRDNNAVDSCGGWSPSSDDTQPWWQVDLGSAQRITALELVTRQNCCDDPGTRQNFEVRASNDPSFASYVVLGSQGSTVLPFKATWTQSVSDATAYRYVRVTKTGYFFIAELRVLGSPTASNGTSNDGLYYYRARYYDPQLGRFISEDPIGFAAGDVNFYAYVGNNPVNANDPSGNNAVTRFVRESAEYLGLKATAAAMQAAKNRAVDMAWKAESQLIKNNLPGTRAWGPDELKFLQQGKPVPGYAGHHINSANGYPSLAGNPDNIQFLKAGEHRALHTANGGTQVPTYGSLMDRTAGGVIPRVSDSSGFSVKSAVIGGVASALTGVAKAAEFFDAIDPTNIILNIPSTGGCDTTGRCSDMPDWSKFGPQSSFGPASSPSGGFLLYPNKPNSNMMQSVYSK